jgi:hypothetical protein
VVAQEQGVRDVTNGRTGAVRVATHGEQELMLRGGEPYGARLLLAPAQEPPDAGAEVEEPLVLVVGQVRTNILYRGTIELENR